MLGIDSPRSIRIALLTALLVLTACGQHNLPPVFLLSFDTCRADVVGVLANQSPSLTPHIDMFASDAIVFDNAFIPAPHTLPSHMSMFTSLYPDVHGVKPEERVLPPSVKTLPVFLKAAGYLTFGVVTSEWLDPDFGFQRGFDSYRRLKHDFTYAERVNRVALEHLGESRAKVAPVFLFLHYYDLHSDFEHGSAHNKLPYYSPPAYRQDLDVSPDGGEFCDAKMRCNTSYLISADKERRVVSDEEIENIRSLYRAAGAHLDSQIGSLIRELKSSGLYDRSIIIMTSDHGEEFREHGRFIHSQPYDETSRVPLLIKLPGSQNAGVRIHEVVEIVDILPTILDYIGIEPPGYLRGESLLKLIRGHSEYHKNESFCQDTINKSRYSIRTNRMRLIADLDGNRTELYDIEDDPDEKHDLAQERPDVASRLEERLRRMVRMNKERGERLETSPQSVLSNEEKDRLKKLGYVD